MEERNKILTSLQKNENKIHHDFGNHHSNSQLHQLVSMQSDSDDDDEITVLDPLLEPTTHTFTTASINVEQLAFSPTSQLSV